MRIGLCTQTTATATQPALAASQLDFLEENVQSFLAPRSDDAAFQIRLAAARAAGKPLEAANCFLPADLPCVGPTVDRPAILAWASTAFIRARQAGISRIVFGSGGSRRIPDGWPREAAVAQFTALLCELAPLAHAQGVTVVVEPLNAGECNFVTSVREGAAIVEAVNHPGVRLLADLYHMARMGETAADLQAVVHLIQHVHIAECAERTAPGVAGDDFVPFLRVLRQAGYARRISIECGKFDLVNDLTRAITEIRRQWAGSVVQAVRAAA